MNVQRFKTFAALEHAKTYLVHTAAYAIKATDTMRVPRDALVSCQRFSMSAFFSNLKFSFPRKKKANKRTKRLKHNLTLDFLFKATLSVATASASLDAKP